MALSAIPAIQQPTLDPVTFEVLRSLFDYACARMSQILQKTSFSPILYDMVDFSNAIYDAELNLLGQTANCPVHLAAMQFSARAAGRRYRSGESQRGRRHRRERPLRRWNAYE